MSFLIVAFAADGDCLGTPSLFLAKKDAFHTYSEMLNKRMDVPRETYMITISKISNFGIEMIDSHEVEV
jgi:hypothetical protein